MSPFKTLLAGLIVGLMPALAMAADSTSALTSEQKAAVEAVVRELLTKKEPEIIIEAARKVEEKSEKEAAIKGQEAIQKNQQALYNDAASPVGGNPKGDVTIVEFFDYSCGYCKMAQGHVEKLLAEDKNVRLVYKEFPILGAASMDVARLALASVSQGKYVAFHNALMTSKDKPSKDVALKIAKDLGMDTAKLEKESESADVAKALAANRALAESMGVRGTPGFVIGDKLYPGALPADQMKKLVADIRAGAKK